MARCFHRMPWLPVLLALLSGCNWGPLGYDFEFDFSSPGLHFVPKRFALGAGVVTEIESDGPSTVVSSLDPDVIRVERIDSSHVELTAVGVGSTTVTVEEDGQVEDYLVEVAVHERHEVLLFQRVWGVVPIVLIDDKALLSDVPQKILVAVYDSEGLLFGGGLTTFVLPDRSEECASDSGASFDERCIILEEGLHILHVEIAGSEEDIVFGAVPEEDVVDLVLLPSKDEEDAEPDELIDVKVAGLTDSGTRVYGLPPEIGLTEGSDPVPFGYRFKPSSAVQLIGIEVLGIKKQMAIRGEPRLPSNIQIDCWSTSFWGC